MADPKYNPHGWRRSLAIVVAIVVFVTPWALYAKYLIKCPLKPVDSALHLIWSPNSEGEFNESVDIRTTARTLTGKREKVVFEFPEAIIFKRLRIVPMTGIFGVVTFYEIRAYEVNGKTAQRIVFDGNNAGWSCKDCNPDKSRSGWELYTYGGLAVASPVLPETTAARIEIELKAVPLNDVIGFLPWISEKYF
jgi:hypothetical protein